MSPCPLRLADNNFYLQPSASSAEPPQSFLKVISGLVEWLLPGKHDAASLNPSSYVEPLALSHRATPSPWENKMSLFVPSSLQTLKL
jgi:hypothetical protein